MLAESQFREIMKTKLFFILITFAANVFAQPDSLWSSIFNEYSRQELDNTTFTSDSCFLMVGTDHQNYQHITSLKANRNGELIWIRKINNNIDKFWGFCGTECSDGNYIVGGLWDENGHHRNIQAFVTKLTSNGDSLWTRYYGGEEEERFLDCISTNDGGMAFMGPTTSFGAGHLDGWLVKTDINGNVEWDKTYGGEEGELLSSIVQTSDNGFAAAGQTASYAAGRTDVYLVKTDSLGNEEWSENYGTEEMDGCYDMIQTSDGGFILAGYSYGICGSGDFYAVRINPQGEMIWDHIYHDRELGIHGICHSVIELEDGGFLLSGTNGLYRPRAGQGDKIFLIRIDSSGEPLWYGVYGSRRMTRGSESFLMEDDGFMLFGWTIGDNYDFFMLRTGRDPVLDNVELLDPSYPSQFTVHQPYPNPFNSSTTITYTLPRPEHVTITIFDQMGRRLTTLLNSCKQPGQHQVKWNADGQASGVYFLTLQAGKETRGMEVVFVR